MFEINEQSIPFVRTRQALIVLDLQNDFLSTGAPLPVQNPPDLLDKILKFVPSFRASGNDIIWIRSQFEASRPINEPHEDSEKVITVAQLLAAKRSGSAKALVRPSQKLREKHSKVALANGSVAETNHALEADDGEGMTEIEETFLTLPPDATPRMVVKGSTGADFAQSADSVICREKDMIFQKSYYSAFKDGTLIQILRAKFVTEIYICGCLTNISVYATAMDAARHGNAITLVEDCLGYRSKALHDEALKKLTEFTGCDIESSEDILADLQRKESMHSKPPMRPPRRRENRPGPGPGGQSSNLESMMGKLSLRRAGASRSIKPARPENSGSPDLIAASQPVEPIHSPLLSRSEADGQNKERVKTKIMTRRRPITKETGVDGGDTKAPATVDKGLLSSTSTTSLKASSVPNQILAPSDTKDSPNFTKQKISSEISDTINTEKPPMTHLTAAQEPTEDMKNAAGKSHKPVPSTHDGTDAICEGDTSVINNLLCEELADGIFEKLRDEVRWQRMSHLGGDVPRLIAVQGEVAEDGSIPIYRHPADESPPLLPFSPTVSLIRAKVEEKLGHPVNHVLVQFYRNGNDYISEHSDKTLDIVRGSFIANASFGALRTMTFRTKRPPKNYDEPKSTEPIAPRQSCRAPLPHNSMCKLGLLTNMRWLHAIRPDKRMESEKSSEELAFNGGRISLTFRLIGTFLDKDEQKIWGQGAIAKTKEEARTVLNGDTPEAEKMIRAFGKENHSSEFDWAASYGEGFDVLHMSNSCKLFLSGDNVADLRVKILLAEYGIAWTEGALSPSFNWKSGSLSKGSFPIPENFPVKFIDNDLSKSTVTGDLATITYLDAIYGQKQTAEPKSQTEMARQCTRFQQTSILISKWRTEPLNVKPFMNELEIWNVYATEASFIAGSTVSVVDFALWPILHEIHGVCPKFGDLEKLTAYYERFKERESVVKTLGLKGKGGEEKVEAEEKIEADEKTESDGKTENDQKTENEEKVNGVENRDAEAKFD